MKPTKAKSIIFVIASVLVIFSIAFILNNPKTIDTTKKSTDVEKTKNVEYTLNGLPADIVECIDAHRITSDLSTEKMEEKFEKYLYNHYTSLEEGLDQIPKHDKIKAGGSECMSMQGHMLMYEEAEEDVNYLFTNMKYGYAGYQYFGGDEKFNEAKSKIVESLKGSKDKYGRIETMVFNKIIIDNLSFIKDGHFRINYMALTDTTYAFMNKDEIIMKDHNTFYIKEGNKKYPILSIEGKNPVNYIKPSLDQDGKIIYKIVYLKDIRKASLDIQITLKDKEEVQKKMELKRVVPPTGGSGSKDYTFKEIQGIPVFKVSSFASNLEKLSQDGLKYADEKIAILDLRGNRGGSCVYGWEWISNFTNNNVNSMKHINVELITEVSKKRMLDTCIVNNRNEEQYQAYFNSINPSDLMGWTKIITPKLENLKNDKVIIVLFDKNSASASEGIISSLSHMDNVIFIGINSAGALNIPGPAINILPNSKLRVDAGSCIGIEPDFVWRDGIGYFPDFWVESNHALDRTIKFINNYIKH